LSGPAQRTAEIHLGRGPIALDALAVLGASSFTFARATWTQTLVDWIDATFAYFHNSWIDSIDID